MKTFNPDDLDLEWMEDIYYETASEEIKQKMNDSERKSNKAREIYERFPDFDAFPVGVTKSPFMWEYHEEEFNMLFLSGFIGIE